MNRRGFIQSFIGAAAMVVVPDNDGVELKSMVHPGNYDEPSGAVGFGLAPAKMEGSAMLYDDPLAPSRSGIISRSEFGKQLADSLNKAFGEAYADLDPDSLEELWIDDENQEEGGDVFISGIVSR